MHRIGIVAKVWVFPIQTLSQDKMMSQPSVLAECRDKKTHTFSIGIITPELCVLKQLYTVFIFQYIFICDGIFQSTCSTTKPPRLDQGDKL